MDIISGKILYQPKEYVFNEIVWCFFKIADIKLSAIYHILKENHLI